MRSLVRKVPRRFTAVIPALESLLYSVLFPAAQERLAAYARRISADWVRRKKEEKEGQLSWEDEQAK